MTSGRSAARARARPAAAWTAVLLLAGCGGSSSPSSTPAAPSPGTPAPTVTGAPTTVATAPATSTPHATADACAVGAQHPPTGTLTAAYPTALAFAPDGRLFYAERAGTVRVWQDGAARVFARVSTVTTEPGGGYSERGLLGLAVSPTFAADRFVYAFYSDADRAHQRVIRWRDCAGTGTQPTVLVTLPAGNDCCHKGGRIAFGPDGRLYVSLGEEHVAAAAQDTSDVRGKILRYDADGSVPADNPFGAGNPVWAYGFRNPFGLAFASDGRLAVTGNGPSGDAGSPGTGYDIAFLSVERGGGYGWPNCYGYGHPLAASSCGSGQHLPDWSSEQTTYVPTGAAFVDAAGPPPYAGHLVFCSFNRGMQVLTPGTPHAAVTQGPSACRLAVVEGPDHALYVSNQTEIVRLG